MHRASNVKTLVLSLVLAIVAAAALRADIAHERGTILNTDWKAMQVQIRDEKDREATWKVARDVKIKFTDKAWENRTPRLEDLRPGMYVHFQFEGTTSVIQQIDVRDVGANYRPPAGSAPPPAGATGNTVSGRVTAVDLRVAQVEVMADQIGRKTYQASDARVLEGLRPGDRVTLVTEERGGQPVVVEAKVTNPGRQR
jgi:Ni/Co efflux regulator RcnB